MTDEEIKKIKGDEWRDGFASGFILGATALVVLVVIIIPVMLGILRAVYR